MTFTMLLLVLAMMNNPAKALCMPNSDWPLAPCHSTFVPSKKIQQEEWAPYYQYKGAIWMKMMKIQMIDAMKNGTIEDWVTGNQSNYNVWRYYYVNDQAPFFRSSVSGLNDEHPYFPPPLQQLTTGIAPKDVACKNDLNLVLNAEDGSPACVKSDTASILVERGWGTLHGVQTFFPSGNIENGITQPLIPPSQLPSIPLGNLPVNKTALAFSKIPNWDKKFVCEKYTGSAIQITAQISNALKFSGTVIDPKGVVHDILPIALNNTRMQIQFSASTSDPDGNYVTSFKVVNGSNTSNVNFYCVGSMVENRTIYPALHVLPP